VPWSTPGLVEREQIAGAVVMLVQRDEIVYQDAGRPRAHRLLQLPA
jgi:hypothetical protein